MNLTPSSPDWEKWIPEESYRVAVSRSRMVDDLKELFRRQIAKRDWVTIRKVELERLDWPSGTLEMLYREYRRREAERMAIKTTPTSEFWGSASPDRLAPSASGIPSISGTAGNGQGRSPESVARASELEAMRRKAQVLGNGANAAEFSTGNNGETIVAASINLAGATAVIVEEKNERKVPLVPGRPVNLGLLPPGTVVRIENQGFELEHRTLSGLSQFIQSLVGHWLVQFEYNGTDNRHEVWFSSRKIG